MGHRWPYGKGMSKTAKRGTAKAGGGHVRVSLSDSTWVPTMAEVLQTLAGHIASIAKDAPRDPEAATYAWAAGLGGYAGTDCPFVMVRAEVTPARGWQEADGGPWGVWAQFSFDGHSVGNRSGAASAYAAAVAPVVAWVAAYWAAKSVSAAAVA